MKKETTKEEIHAIAHDAWSQMYVEEYKSLNVAELQAIKSALIINGGAAIALLGFLASTINAGSNTQISVFASSLGVYVIGVLTSALAYWITYWAQTYHVQYNYNKKLTHKKTLSGLFNDISTLLIVMAYSSFGYGGWVTYNALLLVSQG